MHARSAGMSIRQDRKPLYDTMLSAHNGKVNARRKRCATTGAHPA